MSKRFTDTDKYKKKFIRGLPGAYKMLWDYLYHECNHAGIWHVDFEIAQIYIGTDMPIDREKAIELFNAGEVRIIETKDKSKWFIIPFIEFQYGKLNPANKCHASVISVLEKENIDYENKVLASPLQGAKDKYKEKDKDKDKVKERFIPPTPQELNEYANSIGYKGFDANYFIEWYNTKGWVKRGEKPNWKLKVQTWKKRGDSNGKSGFQGFSRGDNTAGTVSSDKFRKAGIPD